MKDPAEFEAMLLMPLPGDRSTPSQFTEEEEGSDWLALYAQVNGGAPPAPVP